MNDPLETLTLPRLSPPAGGVEAAERAGGRRRTRRRVTTAVAGGSALCLAVVVAVQSGGATSSLRIDEPADDPTAQPTSSALPTVDPHQVAVGPLATAVASAASGGVLAEPQPSTAPQPSVSPSPAPAHSVGHGPADASDGGPVLTRTGPTTDPGFCARGGQVPVNEADGWCASLSGPATIRPGQVATYTFTTCRDPQAGTAEVRFPDRGEIGAFVQGGGEDVPYRWGSGTAFSGSSHVVQYGTAGCWTWQFHWLGEDSAGNALPADTYMLTALSAAPQFQSTPGSYTGPLAGLSVRVVD